MLRNKWLGHLVNNPRLNPRVSSRIYMNLQPIVASVTAILIGMDVFTWDKPAALVLVLLGAFVVTSDRPAKGKSILPDKDHSGKA